MAYTFQLKRLGAAVRYDAVARRTVGRNEPLDLDFFGSMFHLPQIVVHLKLHPVPGGRAERFAETDGHFR